MMSGLSDSHDRRLSTTSYFMWLPYRVAEIFTNHWWLSKHCNSFVAHCTFPFYYAICYNSWLIPITPVKNQSLSFPIPHCGQFSPTPSSTAAFPITLFNGLSQSPPGNTQSHHVHSAHWSLLQHLNHHVSRLLLMYLMYNLTCCGHPLFYQPAFISLPQKKSCMVAILPYVVSFCCIIPLSHFTYISAFILPTTWIVWGAWS